MGYCIDLINGENFIIKKENFEKALEGLKSVFVPEKMPICDALGKHFSWVCTLGVLESKTLEAALREIRYATIIDDNGDITGLIFTGEKYGNENIFFTALAPWVENGSFLSFQGEDGGKWTWKFNNGMVEVCYLN